MDRRERANDPLSAILAILEGWQAGMWTALPGIIQSFDAVARTAVVQPAINAQVRNLDGSYSWKELPLLADVPVYFPRGGGFVLTFPIAAGDECLVVFASRCIDAWWQSGGTQNQAELRMHDLSDGFAFVGFPSQPNNESNISVTAAQLRSLDGSTYVEVGAGEVTVKGANVTVNATTAAVNASTSATVKSPLIKLQNAGTALLALLNSAFATWAAGHVHSNGNAGANTGVPTTTPGASTQTTVVQAE